jgi:type II secretory pathway pseudopilin PulG
MNENQNGFGLIEGMLIVVILGLLGGVGWYVWNANIKTNASLDNSEKTSLTTFTTTSTDKNDKSQGAVKTIDNIKYTAPSGWKNVNAPFKPYKTGSGNYLISSDYKEGGTGQLSIVAGAYIYFDDTVWVNIKPTMTTEQAVNVIKNTDAGGYFDQNSAKTTNIGGKKVIIFDAGHTTDGVTVLYKTAGARWLEAGFSTVAGDDTDYKAQNSPHYQTYITWLEEFIKLN